MRPGQQSKRSRGRGGNNNNNNNNFNRKGANPLTRTYDSNGPDVKVRGTAQHIAEKYMSLARDAQGSGDRVVAENYLQHAEHYNRIISTAQAQMQERFQREERSDDGDGDENGDNVPNGNANYNNNSSNNNRGRGRGNGQSGSDDRNDRNDRRDDGNYQQREQRPVDADGPQPMIDGMPAEVAAETSDGQPSDKPRSTRRRAPASPRPRRTKRASSGEEGASADTTEVAVPEAATAAPNADGDVAEAPAPKKPVRRKRTPKAEAAPAEGNASEGHDQSAMAEATTE